MAKLSKAEAKGHQHACELLKQDTLSFDDRWAVYENWREDANHVNSMAGAFFTPVGLANDFAIEIVGRRVIDLCAGIGVLSFMHWNGCQWGGKPPEIVCVEMNPDYLAVGRKLLPEATWVEASVFDLPDLGHFQVAIGNPPFGKTPRNGRAPRYTGPEFEFAVIDIASDIADLGVFIVPQMSAPFRYSGCPAGGWPETRRDGIGSGYMECPTDAHAKLLSQAGIVLEAGCGIDTSFYRREWHGTSPATEIVIADFVEARSRRMPAQSDLFGAAA